MTENQAPDGGRDSWHSYPSIFHLGHKAIEELLGHEVIVEENIAGSQFSWCAWPDPERGDAPRRRVQHLMHRYSSEARWHKALQHLREAGQIEQSPRDIGLLIREVPTDIDKECADEIRDALYAHFWPKIRRGLTTGLPEWYRNELLRSAFDPSPESAGGAGGGGAKPEEG